MPLKTLFLVNSGVGFHYTIVKLFIVFITKSLKRGNIIGLITEA